MEMGSHASCQYRAFFMVKRKEKQRMVLIAVATEHIKLTVQLGYGPEKPPSYFVVSYVPC